MMQHILIVKMSKRDLPKSIIDIFTKYAWVKHKNFFFKLMQEWFGNNDILMYSTHNKGSSVIAEIFMKTLKAKIYEKMTVNDSKSYLLYLNKLVDQCNNAYHHSFYKKPVNNDYSALNEKIERNHEASKFKFNVDTKSLGIRIVLVKVILKIGQEKY